MHIPASDQITFSKNEESIFDKLYQLEPYKKLSEPISLYIQENDEKIQQVVLGALGSGGSKRTYELEHGMALLFPCSSSLVEIANSTTWPVNVDDELMGTERVKQLDLLGCNLKKVKVYFTAESTNSILAYITETFSQLSQKNIWVLDQKIERASTWTGPFFHKPSDAIDEKNWATLINPFLKDIAILLSNGIRLHVDNVNLAVVKNPNQVESISDYEIRYFGFDFSSSSGRKVSFLKLTDKDLNSIVPSVIEDVLPLLVEFESSNINYQKQRDLISILQEKSVKQVFSEIKQYQGSGLSNF